MADTVGVLRLQDRSESTSSDENIEKSLPPQPASPGVLKSMQVRIRMVGFLLVGIIIMIAHDRFYSYLSGKPFLFGQSVVGLVLQEFYSAVGNLIALLGRFALSLAIGNAFVQLFWMNLRQKSHSVAEIDSAMGVKDSPFGLGAILSWRYMFWLSVLPALAVGNAQIIVFASGAVQVDFAPFDDTCTMNTVDLTNSDIGVLTANSTATTFSYLSPAAQTRGFVAQVIMSGENFAPLILNDKDIASIIYNVSFHAPALNCTDVSSTFDFTDGLPLPPTAADQILVWNATYALGSGNLVLDVASRVLSLSETNINDVSPGSQQEAVSCTMFNGTYDVQVNQTFSGDIFLAVLNITLNNPLSNASTTVFEEIQMNAIADSFARLLNGTAAYDPNVFDFTPESPLIVYSPFGDDDPTGDNPWFWTQDLTVTLPVLMSDVSASLLSGRLSETGSLTLKTTQTDCQTISLFFLYNRARLLWSYGASLIVTAVCIAVGFYAIHRNGVEETLDFSRILRSVVNDSLLNVKDQISSKTVVQASKNRTADLRLSNGM
ncbi:hypothetical protein SCHPADRAFT_996374 [Schizopora paradoxa]|uniref:Uncharacterized protein n=1 Tax=Schizopora paradoxa TaxID=27342 RepID=A0A0H2RSB9_9AGAM|nr:hypothetical protein SCHPADRAFT_996374 [Schizopora paradoxa]